MHSPAAVAAAYGITLYQRHLSPRKGFSCAHRRAHGGFSCSEYVRRAVLEEGVWRAWALARERFRACGDAARGLRAMSDEDADGGESGGEGGGPAADPATRRGLRDRGRSCREGDWADACDLAGCTADLSCDAADLFSGCDSHSCHGHGCDGCDGCNGCDAPSCSHVLLLAALVLPWAGRLPR